MKVDGGLGLTPDISAIAESALKQEAAGYDGVWSAEVSHDPFLPLVVAAANTTELELGTSIAVAFAAFSVAESGEQNMSSVGPASFAARF
jgi:alkanesulfonate monooxygenase SsuD/methylene tetrahydromethanopterin reductase-like flavin-dependent oxidoreductase (luciferase family)